MFNLAPRDIQKQEFKKVLRGYDPVEVDTFLEMVAEEFEQIVKNNKELEQRFKDVEQKIVPGDEPPVEEKDELISEVEIVDQPEQPHDEVKKEAAFIIQEAEIKARDILLDAKKDLQKTLDDIEILKSQKKQFVKRMKSILKSEFELIKILDAEGQKLGELKAERGKAKEEKFESPVTPEPLNSAETSIPQHETESFSEPEITVVDEDLVPSTVHEINDHKTEPTIDPTIDKAERMDDKNPEKHDENRKNPDAEATYTDEAGEATKISKIQDGFSLIDRIIDEDEDDENGGK